MPQGIEAATEELVEEMKELQQVSEIVDVSESGVHFRISDTLSARRLTRLAPDGFSVDVTITEDEFTGAHVSQE